MGSDMNAFAFRGKGGGRHRRNECNLIVGNENMEGGTRYLYSICQSLLTNDVGAQTLSTGDAPNFNRAKL